MSSDNIFQFPKISGSDPMDEEVMLSVIVNGKGNIDLLINSYCETVEQHNWLIAKMAEAAARIVDRKKDLIR